MPVVVITAVVGTTIFGTLNKSPDTSWHIIAGLVALLGTVLSALQTSLGFAQDTEKHKAAGEAYRSVSRSFDMFLLKYAEAAPDQRQDAFAELDQLVHGLNDLPKQFPALPDRFYDQAKKEYKKEHNIGKPNVGAQQSAASNR